MQLTDEQQVAVDSFDKVRRGLVRRLSIGGHAGTGKTTVIKAIVEAHPDVLCCAPTGKAAHVLRSKGVNAVTLHSLIYVPRGQDHEGNVIFEHKQTRDMPRCVIVDEASMLSKQLVRDLEKKIRHVLYVGDHGQLEPIGDDPGIMRKPDVRLEQIHRQAADSPIIQFAHHVRRGGKPHTLGPDALVQRGMSDDLAGFDVVLVGFNDSRIRANAWIRQQRGYKGRLPEVGETVICLRNDKEFQVWNGMLGIVVDIDPATNMLTVDTDDGLRQVPFELKQFGAKTTIPWERSTGYVNPTLWDFGYALTCHKCVSGETLIETANGWQRIDAVATQRGQVVAADGKLHRFDAFIERPKARVLTLNCENGYSVRVTPDHRMRVYDAQTHTWIVKEADDIVTGTYLRLRLGQSATKIAVPALPSLPEGDVRARAIKAPSLLTEDLAEFIGMMVSDGTLFRSGVRLTKYYSDVVDRFARLIESLFGLSAKYVNRKTPTVEAHSTILSSWLSNIGGMAPRDKYVPDVIMRAPRTMRAAFLRGLFEDGTVNVKDETIDHIEFSNRSPAVVRVVQTLLLEFGIISTIQLNKRTPSLYIYGDGIGLYRDLIGFVCALKNARLQLPHTRSHRVRIPIDPLRVRGKHHNNAHTRGYISRAIAQDLGFDEELNFHYVRVLSIEKGEDKTYCLHVPSVGAFLQNRFDGLNSQGSEWDRVAVVEEISSTWSAERWRYTAATRARQQLRWIRK